MNSGVFTVTHSSLIMQGFERTIDAVLTLSITSVVHCAALHSSQPVVDEIASLHDLNFLNSKTIYWYLKICPKQFRVYSVKSIKDAVTISNSILFLRKTLHSFFMTSAIKNCFFNPEIVKTYCYPVNCWKDGYALRFLTFW